MHAQICSRKAVILVYLIDKKKLACAIILSVTVHCDPINLTNLEETDGFP
jgi:hypothetical protein